MYVRLSSSFLFALNFQASLQSKRKSQENSTRKGQNSKCTITSEKNSSLWKKKECHYLRYGRKFQSVQFLTCMDTKILTLHTLEKIEGRRNKKKKCRVEKGAKDHLRLER